MSTTPTVLCDFYKISHRSQYPKNTDMIYSTWTPRMSRIPDIHEVVVFGIQGFIKKWLQDYFNFNFFLIDEEYVVKEYQRVIAHTIGAKYADSDHIRALHKLGYLPVRIKALPEGTRCPIGVPMLTIENTIPEFFWVTNYLETLMSCEMWQAITSATLAFEYRKLLDRWAKITGNERAVDFQAHDFSMRGMGGVASAQSSGAGHLLSFVGTDTIPAITYLEDYYGANLSQQLVGTSIPATEHSVMEAYGDDNEYEAYKRLITEVYPDGLMSIVSDTWDLWAVLTDIIAKLKPEIMSRNGKVVIRPDSGDPVDILCGDWNSEDDNARKGVIEILWDIFGGTINKKGYRELDPHIGAIYGDAITLGRAEQICDRLAKKGFASTNVVFGVGSYTYQYNTRDTFGFALKTTYGIFGGKGKQLFKDPVTDTGKFKKSAKGMVVVVKNTVGVLELRDGLELKQRNEAANVDDLKDVFINGVVTNETNLSQIRRRLGSIIA